MRLILHFILIIFIYNFSLSQNDITKTLNKNAFDEIGIRKDSITPYNLPKAEQPNQKNQSELNKQQLHNFIESNTTSTSKKRDTIIKQIPYEIIKRRSDSLLLIQQQKLNNTAKQINTEKSDTTTKLITKTVSKQITDSLLLLQNQKSTNTTNTVKTPDNSIKTDTPLKQIPYEIIKKQSDSLLLIIEKEKQSKQKANSKLDSISTKTISTYKKDSTIKQASTFILDTPKINKQIPYEIIKKRTDSLLLAIEKQKQLKSATLKVDSVSTPKNTNSIQSIQNVNLDITKKEDSIKDFSFDTQPFTSKGGEIKTIEKPKQAEVAAPSKTGIILSKQEQTEQDKHNIRNQYLREADSIRYKNQLLLDSLLATLPIKVPVLVKPDDYIEVFLSGGDLYGGVNPKEYDRTIIYPNGLLQREYKSKLNGVVKLEKKLNHEEIVKLAQYIVDLGFFEMNEYYECDVKDVACKQRMNQYPTPIPLKLSVSVGIRRNNVTVDFYAPEIDNNWVNYPKNLEKIVKAIQTFTIE